MKSTKYAFSERDDCMFAWHTLPMRRGRSGELWKAFLLIFPIRFRSANDVAVMLTFLADKRYRIRIASIPTLRSMAFGFRSHKASCVVRTSKSLGI